jgi:uncharacterized protein (DUF4415 family)
MPKRKSAGKSKLDRDLELRLQREHGLDSDQSRRLMREVKALVHKHRKKRGGERAKGVVVRGTWSDPDDAPELTQDYFERADVYRGEKLIRRGRPPSEHPKEAIKLRVDPDVLAYFRATGPGWQTRINDALRRAAKLKMHKVS